MKKIKKVSLFDWAPDDSVIFSYCLFTSLKATPSAHGRKLFKQKALHVLPVNSKISETNFYVSFSILLFYHFGKDSKQKSRLITTFTLSSSDCSWLRPDRNRTIPDAAFPNAVPHLPPTFCLFIPNALFHLPPWDICRLWHLPLWTFAFLRQMPLSTNTQKMVFLPPDFCRLRHLPSWDICHPGTFATLGHLPSWDICHSKTFAVLTQLYRDWLKVAFVPERQMSQNGKCPPGDICRPETFATLRLLPSWELFWVDKKWHLSQKGKCRRAVTVPLGTVAAWDICRPETIKLSNPTSHHSNTRNVKNICFWSL